MKIGVFSGTFDPVHDGHIWLAHTALEQFGLERVAFLPEPSPRRKIPQASYKHRRVMLKTATRDDDRLVVLDIPTASHSAQSTMEFIRQQYGIESMVKIIIGADVFENIHNWDDFDLLKEEVEFLVCLRSEDDGELTLNIATKLGINIEMVSSDYSFVSSSKVRGELVKGKIPKGISQDIYEYIRDNKLYETK